MTQQLIPHQCIESGDRGKPKKDGIALKHLNELKSRWYQYIQQR